MSRIFTYTYNEQKINHEVSDKEILNALCEILFDDYFADGNHDREKVVKHLAVLIVDNDLVDWLMDGYENEVKDRFANVAFEKYIDASNDCPCRYCPKKGCGKLHATCQSYIKFARRKKAENERVKLIKTLMYNPNATKKGDKKLWKH